MATQIHIAATAQQVAEDFARYFAEWVKGKPRVTLALSGGSTPKVLFRLWAEHYRDNIDWQKVHFFWGDERCVPPDDEESNFNMANGLFLSNIDVPGENIHRIRGEEPPDVEAQRYEGEILRAVPAQNGIPSFDMILLGMGGDGHTASIFPGQMELLSAGNLCAVATHPESGQKRVTLTGKVLNNAAEAAFLVTGKEKAAMVKKVIRREAGSQHLPATHIDPLQGKLHWFIDQGAAVEL